MSETENRRAFYEREIKRLVKAKRVPQLIVPLMELESENAKLSALAAEWKAEADSLRAQLEKQKAVVEVAGELKRVKDIPIGSYRRLEKTLGDCITDILAAYNALASLDAGEKEK